LCSHRASLPMPHYEICSKSYMHGTYYDGYRCES
jgi:hypothetical protein